jgi:hypothetical protein
VPSMEAPADPFWSGTLMVWNCFCTSCSVTSFA